MESDNATIARRWYEDLFNRRDMTALHDIVAADFIAHAPGGITLRGPDAVKAALASYRAMYTDPCWTIEDLLTAGDSVVVRARGESTYRGGWLDAAYQLRAFPPGETPSGTPSLGSFRSASMQGTAPTIDIGVTFDYANPAVLGSFWAQTLGYIEEGSGDGYAAIIDPEGRRPRILFLKVSEPKVVKNRVHLDLHGADMAAEVQ